MRPVCRLLTVAVVVSVPALLHAQQANERKGGPEKGTWGAEASTGGNFSLDGGEGAALLRFFSPRVALVAGLSYSRIGSSGETINDGSGVIFNNGYSVGALRAGIRRYSGTGLGLRPVIGGGLLVSRSTTTGETSTGAGGYAEAGAAWFFNPHVSLGVLGSIAASKRDERWTAGGTLARLTGAVYF